MSNQLAWYEARRILEKAGYASILSRGDLITLFAWKPGRQGIQFIKVLSTRSLSLDSVAREVLESLIAVSKSGWYPGQIQLWVRAHKQWMRFLICQNGVLPLGGFACHA
jgi:hypothetical protein